MSSNADTLRSPGASQEGGQGADAQGVFGRTERATITVTARDGELFAAQVYRCVNVSERPELRARVLSSALYEVAPRGGGEPIKLAIPIRYHDEERGIFALILPESLRHQEWLHRAELMADLGRVAGEIPGYIRNFHLVWGVRGLLDLEEELAEAALRDELAEDSSAGGVDGLSEGSAAASAEDNLAASEELASAWGRVEQEREQLLLERGQLDEVRARIDRERAQMDDVEARLAAERAEIAELRSELQARELNVEQKEMQLEQGLAQSSAVEATQVVTDDQFIAVFESEAEDLALEDELSAGFYAEPSEPTGVLQSPYGDEAAEASEPPVETSVTRVDAVGVAKKLEPNQPDEIALSEGRILASIRVERETLDALTQAQELSFFVQGIFADEEAEQGELYPFIGLLLAALDDDGSALASVAWPLNPADAEDGALLSRLAEDASLHAALYDEGGHLGGVYEIISPLNENISWLRARAEELLDALPADSPALGPGAFRAAADRWLDPDFELFGRLKHNFSADSFADATTPAEVSLAAGIVGFWSAPERVEYLITNRSFPLAQFETIQKRVVRRAVQQGIYINDPLRLIALEMELAPTEEELAERLVTEFAEVSVGLRRNDLDPLKEWENWDELLALAEDFGVNLDAEMLELAEASLKRAQDFQSAEAGRAPSGEHAAAESGQGEVDHAETELDPVFSADSLLVAKRSEATGVTYFLPDDALIDTFDDLSEMPFEDLKLLLQDPAGRLEAAQMLVERFEEPGLHAALEASETMMTAEVAGLARFVEGKALQLESALVDSLQDAGPSATYIAARALAGMKSGAGAARLIAAYREPAQRGNAEQTARALVQYGEALLPDLRRSIQMNGHDDALALLIQELEQVVPGTIAKLAMDSSKKVRKAANAARKR